MSASEIRAAIETGRCYATRFPFDDGQVLAAVAAFDTKFDTRFDDGPPADLAGAHAARLMESGASLIGILESSGEQAPAKKGWPFPDPYFLTSGSRRVGLGEPGLPSLIMC